jgi:acyl-CoA synthetase (AMP-forming)/AMP-acid ligase II
MSADLSAEPGFTLAGLLRRIAAESPDASAVSMDGRTLTFAQVHARSSQVAHLLRQRGVARGDRVAVLDKNAPSFYDVLFGAAKIGAVTVGLNFRLAPAELATIVDDAAPSLVFASPELRHLLPDGTPVVELGESFDRARAACDDTDIDGGTTPDDIALQLYSSGTTGRPKGAMLTHANLSWTPRMGREFYGMDLQTVNLVPSPLFHIGGVGYALTAMGQGGHTVLVRDVDPGAMLDLLARHRVTHSFMVPSVVQMLIEHPSIATTDLSSLRRIAYGGAPMGSALLLDAMRVLGCEFMAVYGMTETAGSVISMAPKDHDPGGPRAGLLRSIGRALPWLEVRIVDPLGTEDRVMGEVGEIWVRSPQNMAGYWAQPELTASTLVGDGWLRTGDAAYRDAGGFVFMHDRIKDIIVSGGENIYPAEVEKVLSGHPAVAELAVIGVPSQRWGETVKAVVVPRAGVAVDPDELIAWTRERLAHYKCPTSVDLVDELPRNATGKILKHHLRSPYWQQLGAERR